MKGPVGYGIDFGTTNSSIAAAFADRVEVLSVASGSMPESVPSIIFLGRDGNELAGNDAVERFLVEGGKRTRCGVCSLVTRYQGQPVTDCKQHRVGSGCQDARLISGVKGFLSLPERKATHSWARDFTLDGLAAIIMRRLKGAADRAYSTRVDRVVMGYPVAFAGTEGPAFEENQLRAEARLREAAEEAGFREVELYPEPAAAAIAEVINEGRVLMLDFGGGTFDSAIVEFSPEGAETIAMKGTAVGGEMLDAELFRAKVAPALGIAEGFGSDGRRLPYWIRQGLESLAGLAHLMANRELEPRLAEFRKLAGGERLHSLDELLYGGQAYRFYRVIEDAKVRLSTEDSTRIHFVRPGISIDIVVTRAEFERLIADHLLRVEAIVLDTLNQAQLEPGDIDLVLRTGGSSRIPMFVRFLEAIFGDEKVQERHAFTTVAHGLGVHAQRLWAA